MKPQRCRRRIERAQHHHALAGRAIGADGADHGRVHRAAAVPAGAPETAEDVSAHLVQIVDHLIQRIHRGTPFACEKPI